MADAAHRLAALDTGRHILLQAPAGSGKTTVLAQRFLAALAVVDEPEQVLAITFTRKAAAEMRERVLRALESALPENLPDRARWESLRANVLAQAARRGWEPEDLPLRLRIQTIDSLAHEIARTLPLLGRRHAELRVIDDAGALHDLAARAALREAEAHPDYREAADLLLRRLDNQHEQAVTLLAELLATRNRWQPVLLAHPHTALGAEVERSLARITRVTLGEALRILPADLCRTAADLARRAAAHLRDAGEAGPGDWCAWLDPAATLGSEPAHLAGWRGVVDLVLKADGEPRAASGINRRQGFPPDDKPLKGAWRDWQQAVLEVPGAIPALQRLRALPPVTLDPDEHASLAALARLMLFAAAELKLVFRERGLVDHAEVAAIARQALRDLDSGSEHAVRESLRVRHLLVDEFQDTSPDQVDLIEDLLTAWDASEARSLFLVGDPMQSIYLFRHSEVGLFLQVRARGLAGITLEPLRLQRNFRSRPGLVAWANEAFHRVFPREEDLRTSAVGFLPAVAARGEGDAPGAEVEVWPWLQADASAEARRIAAAVRSARARDAQCSIAVLVQTRALAGPVLAALAAEGLPVQGVDLAPLAERAAVRELLAIGQALLDARDRGAWLAVLRSPAAGFTLRELECLAQAAGNGPLVGVLEDPAAAAAVLDGDGAQRLARVAPVLVAAWRARGSSDLATLVETTWRALGADLCVAGPGERAAAEQYLAAVRRLQVQEGRVDGARLAALAAQLRDRGEASGAHPVEVLTIHHAKGLEWDVVFVPGLGRTARADKPPLLRWLQLPAEDGSSDLLLAVHSLGEPRSSDPLSKYIAGLQRERQRNERVRLLYVAVTRARQKLVLSGHASRTGEDGTAQPAAQSLLQLLWPAVREAFAALPADGPAGARPAAAGVVAQPWARLPARYERPRSDAAVRPTTLARHDPDGVVATAPEYSWVGPLARAAGTVMHAELEWLAREGAAGAGLLAGREPGCVARLLEQGIAPSVAQRSAAQIVSRLQALCAQPRLHWLLFAPHREAHSELALSGLVDGELRSVVIDRCFVADDGMRWVVDFKTSSHTGGGLEEFLQRELVRYAPQLALYAELAARLGPQPVRVALYFPWLGEFREFDPAPSPAG